VSALTPSVEISKAASLRVPVPQEVNGSATESLSPTVRPTLAASETPGVPIKAAVSHTHLSTAISDSTSAGRAMLTAANLAAQQTLLGLGSLAYLNTIPVTQIPGNLAFIAPISPAALIANTNDWTPTGWATAAVVKMSSSSAINITGFAGTSDGDIKIIQNTGLFPITIPFESASSAAANRVTGPFQQFATTVPASYILPAGNSVTLIYDANAFRWRAPAQVNTFDQTVIPGYLSGLTLSTAGSSATFGIAAGAANDAASGGMMVLASAFTKTTGAWAVGSGNGSLDVGSIANSTFYYPYLIKRTDTGVVDLLTSLAPGSSSTFTVTVATPGVVTQANHGLQANAQFIPTTTGALPTGLVTGTVYYVKTVTDVNTFTLSTTQGGTAIATTGTQSGTHTGSSTPTLPTGYTLSRRIGAMKTNGSAQWTSFTQIGDDFIWAVSVQDTTGAATTVSRTLYTLTVPPGISVKAAFRGSLNAGSAFAIIFTSPSETDIAPQASLVADLDSTTARQGGSFERWTNTSAQIGGRATLNGTLTINTCGWRDNRGK
jgi:hypothetical protein